MAGFHNVLLPESISVGSTGGPSWKTDIATLPSGQEQRTSRWARPRWRYNVNLDVITPSQARTLISFFIARQGAAYAFLFQDPIDYSSAMDGTSTPDDEDQELANADGVSTRFQIIKTYSDGTYSFDRTIRRPVSGSVVAAIDGVSTSAFTVDYSTGEIVFDSAPADGTSVTCGFQFHVPVRLAGQEWSQWTWDEGTILSLPGMDLIEDIEPAPISGEFFPGGAQAVSMSTDSYAIDLVRARVWDITPNASNRTVILPNPANIPSGGPIFYVKNSGGVALDLDDHEGNNVGSIGAGETATVLLFVDGSGNKVWGATIG